MYTYTDAYLEQTITLEVSPASGSYRYVVSIADVEQANLNTLATADEVISGELEEGILTAARATIEGTYVAPGVEAALLGRGFVKDA